MNILSLLQHLLFIRKGKINKEFPDIFKIFWIIIFNKKKAKQAYNKLSQLLFNYFLFRYDFLAPNKDALPSQYRGENVEGKIFKSRR